MNINSLPIYYYPTRVFIVDDNRDFLLNFSFQLDPNLAYCMFTSAHEALQYLLSVSQETNSLTNRVLSVYQHTENDPVTNQTVNIDLSQIHEQVLNKNRFNDISVVIVDYDMPGINGIEFCRALKNSPCKKIMLTGKADEKLAIEAFNEGLIDVFVQKSSSRIIDYVNDSIKQLQYEYFQNASYLITKLLAMHSPSFFCDEQFIKFFMDLCAKTKTVEYYLTEITGSFLLFNIKGKASCLVVKLYEDLSLHYELACDVGASSEVLEAIRSGIKLPYVPQAKDYYKLTAADWEHVLYPAKELKGQHIYYYAWIDELPDFSSTTARIHSYHDYLERFDSNNRNLT